MKKEKLRIYIADTDRRMASSLRTYLKSKFGGKFNISLYFSAENCLRMLHKGVHMVILDEKLNKDGLKHREGNEVLQEIKEQFPTTEVIIMTNQQDIANAVNALRVGASGYVVKDENTGRKILRFIDESIHQPIRAWASQYGVDDYLVLFFITFLVIGLAAFAALKIAS